MCNNTATKEKNYYANQYLTKYNDVKYAIPYIHKQIKVNEAKERNDRKPLIEATLQPLG